MIALTKMARFAAMAIVLVVLDVRAEEPAKFARERPADMKHILLDLDVNLKDQRIDATAHLSMTALRPLGSVKFDAVGFAVTSVRGSIGDGKAAELIFAADGQHLEVFFESPAAMGEVIDLEVTYVVEKPGSGLHFHAPSEGNEDVPLQVWSQGQSSDNRYWIPCFDHPNEMQTSEIIATVDAGLTVISNGRLVERKEVDGGRLRYHWLQDRPHVSYLITLVVGEFAMREQSWGKIPVQYYVPPDRVDDVERTFSRTPEMLQLFQDKIGIEYPWAKYAQVCCHDFGGGMENTSATTLGESALVTRRGIADGNEDDLIAHELAHQWFGDLLTCREWAHLWLNEGFASFFEAVWAEHVEGADGYGVEMARMGTRAIEGGRDLPVVLRAYESEGQQFDSRAYPKGAYIVHMLRRRVGDVLFWKAINRYVRDNAGRSVETVDLRRAFEETTGRSFERFFHDWTERPGCPEVNIRYVWNSEDQQIEVIAQQLQQTGPFEFPLRIEFVSPGGGKTVQVVRNFDTALERFVVPLSERPAMIRVDPDQAVLMELTEEKSKDQWITQLLDDPSAVGRLYAAKHLADTSGRDVRAALVDALHRESYWRVQVAIADSLGKFAEADARDALLERLSSTDARVRRACLAALVDCAESDLVASAVGSILENGDASDRVEAEAIRVYAKTGANDVYDRLKIQLKRDSDRDIIRGAALEALGDSKLPEALPLILTYCESGQSVSIRRSAVSAMRGSIKRGIDDDATVESLAVILEDCLKSTDARLRANAVTTAGMWSDRPAHITDMMRELVEKDENRWVQRAARSALGESEPILPSGGMRRRAGRSEDNGALRKENESLQKQITELEARITAMDQLIQQLQMKKAS